MFSNCTSIRSSLLRSKAFFRSAARCGSVWAFNSAIRKKMSSTCLYFSAIRFCSALSFSAEPRAGGILASSDFFDLPASFDAFGLTLQE